jgi:DNA-damage-inducible protein J
MAASDLVQARIDPRVKERAAAVLQEAGLTVSDAVRILLTRTANEGALPLELIDPARHEAWFRAKVLEALADTSPAMDHAEVKARFAERRREALARTRDAKV